MKDFKNLGRAEQIREANTKKRWCLLFLDKGQNDKVNNRKRIAQRFADLWYNDERNTITINGDVTSDGLPEASITLLKCHTPQRKWSPRFASLRAAVVVATSIIYSKLRQKTGNYITSIQIQCPNASVP